MWATPFHDHSPGALAMPTHPPERSARGLTWWHIVGSIAGFIAITWLIGLTIDTGTKPADEPITTGIAPADQSGKPLPPDATNE